MAEKPIHLAGPTALTGSLATIFTNSNTNNPLILRNILLTNTTNASVSVRIHIIPSGGIATISNAILYDTPIDAYDVVQMTDVGLPLYNGDFIRALGPAVNLTMTLVTVPRGGIII